LVHHGKYYESITAFASTGIPNRLSFNEAPDLQLEMTDPYVIEKIKVVFIKSESVATFDDA